jgi:O-antigen ligase
VARKAKFFMAEAVPYWALIVFLVLTFLTGGASRADVQSLIILRPAAVIFCGVGLWSLRLVHVKAYKLPFGMAAAIFAFVLSHLIPLPPSIWGALPGRGIINEIDKVAELGAVWRPISMVPSATWNAFYSLFGPLAVLILGVQLTRDERFKLLPWVLGLGLFSGFWGILQVVGDPQGSAYLYNVTNNGAAVGLFANRNHQAILLACLFPMLAVYASTSVRSEEQSNLKLSLAIGAGGVLVPLLLVTGSRAGLILGVLGLVSVTLLYRKPASLTPKKRKRDRFDPRYALAAFAVLCLGALTIIMSRAEAFQRLFAAGQGEDQRFKVWVPIADMAWKYFPFGSGIGSFVEAYQIDEPHELLSPEYFNHAHNDWLEVYMTAGLPALILLAIAIIAVLRTAFAAFRKAGAEKSGEGRAPIFAKLGAITIVILALGSIGDYPLRAPSLACIFVIATLWLAGDRAHAAKSNGALGTSALGNAKSG